MSLQIVESVRSKYPTPLGAKHGRFLLEVAAALNLGLLKKNGGTFVTLPDGTQVSQDCVMKPNGVHWDILFDGENSASPRFDKLINSDGSPYLTDPNNYYSVQAQPVPNPEPTPTPAPTPNADIAALIAVINELKADIADMQADFAVVAQHVDGLDVEINALRASLDLGFSELLTVTDEIEPLLKNPPFYKGRIFGASITLNPERR